MCKSRHGGCCKKYFKRMVPSEKVRCFNWHALKAQKHISNHRGSVVSTHDVQGLSLESFAGVASKDSYICTVHTEV